MLIPVGCMYDRGVFVQRLFPFRFAFVKVEDTFGSTAKRKFAISHFEAKYANIDHSAALFNGLGGANWPDIIIQTCWPHLARKLIEKRKLLVENTDERMKLIKNLVRGLHECRSPAEFEVCSRKVVNDLEDLNETHIASWLSDQYLKSPWDSWYIGIASPGLLSQQQGIESFNGVNKKVSVVTLNASFSHCVEVTFKSILEYCGRQLTPKSITLAAPAPLLSEYVSEAAELVQNDNCSSVKDMDLYFNQTEYIRKPSNVVRQKNITKTRIKKNYVRPGALLFSPVWLKIEFLSR